MTVFVALALPGPVRLKAGDRLRHIIHGAVTVTRIRKSDDAVFVRTADGIEGTVLRQDLRAIPA